MGRLPVHDGVVGFFRALPVLVPVHRVVPARDGGDVAGARLLDHAFEVCEVARPALGGRVSTVGEGVRDGLDAAVGGEFDERVEVGLVGMNAAVAHQSHEVDPAAVLVGVGERRLDGLVFREPILLDGARDAGVALVDDPSRADGEVADLAVAHLSVGESHCATRRVERAERAPLGEPVHRRRRGRPDRV